MPKSKSKSKNSSEETTPLLKNAQSSTLISSPPLSPSSSKPTFTSSQSISSSGRSIPNQPLKNYNPPTHVNSKYGSSESATSPPSTNGNIITPLHGSPPLSASGFPPSSSGSIHPAAGLPVYAPSYHKIGPQRTSYTTQKLKLLPEQPITDDEESGREVYSQVTRIKDVLARKDAERLGKAHRSLLPRVTAYCTASSYRMKDLNRYLAGRKQHKASPKLFDECLYTPYTYRRDSNLLTPSSSDPSTSNTDSSETVTSPKKSSSKNKADEQKTQTNPGLIRLDDEGGEIDVELTGHSDVFIFEYGVVVFWGFTESEERRFLKELDRFENEKLADEDIQVEEFNYYITKSYQPRIYNDFITLRDGSNYMVKLSISHALAQSVKISLFEELVDNTIEDTQDFPQEVAVTGKISMSRKDIMKSIGELFILRINVNLHGSVLDSPELMWAEPHLEPIYQATRGYLEITQRVQLLNQRLEVISDLLQMLKEQMGYAHGEYLEFIVIVLIAAEILVAIVNILVDYFATQV